jgi:hypothetical protein
LELLDIEFVKILSKEFSEILGIVVTHRCVTAHNVCGTIEKILDIEFANFLDF